MDAFAGLSAPSPGGIMTLFGLISEEKAFYLWTVMFTYLGLVGAWVYYRNHGDNEASSDEIERENSDGSSAHAHENDAENSSPGKKVHDTDVNVKPEDKELSDNDGFKSKHGENDVKIAEIMPDPTALQVETALQLATAADGETNIAEKSCEDLQVSEIVSLSEPSCISLLHDEFLCETTDQLATEIKNKEIVIQDHVENNGNCSEVKEDLSPETKAVEIFETLVENEISISDQNELMTENTAESHEILNCKESEKSVEFSSAMGLGIPNIFVEFVDNDSNDSFPDFGVNEEEDGKSGVPLGENDDDQNSIAEEVYQSQNSNERKKKIVESFLDNYFENLDAISEMEEKTPDLEAFQGEEDENVDNSEKPNPKVEAPYLERMHYAEPSESSLDDLSFESDHSDHSISQNEGRVNVNANTEIPPLDKLQFIELSDNCGSSADSLCRNQDENSIERYVNYDPIMENEERLDFKANSEPEMDETCVSERSGNSESPANVLCQNHESDRFHEIVNDDVIMQSEEGVLENECFPNDFYENCIPYLANDIKGRGDSFGDNAAAAKEDQIQNFESSDTFQEIGDKDSDNFHETVENHKIEPIESETVPKVPDTDSFLLESLDSKNFHRKEEYPEVDEKEQQIFAVEEEIIELNSETVLRPPENIIMGLESPFLANNVAFQFSTETSAENVNDSFDPENSTSLFDDSKTDYDEIMSPILAKNTRSQIEMNADHFKTQENDLKTVIESCDFKLQNLVSSKTTPAAILTSVLNNSNLNNQHANDSLSLNRCPPVTANVYSDKDSDFFRYFVFELRENPFQPAPRLIKINTRESHLSYLNITENLIPSLLRNLFTTAQINLLDKNSFDRLCSSNYLSKHVKCAREQIIKRSPLQLELAKNLDVTCGNAGILEATDRAERLREDVTIDNRARNPVLVAGRFNSFDSGFKSQISGEESNVRSVCGGPRIDLDNLEENLTRPYRSAKITSAAGELNGLDFPNIEENLSITPISDEPSIECDNLEENFTRHNCLTKTTPTAGEFDCADFPKIEENLNQTSISDEASIELDSSEVLEDKLQRPWETRASELVENILHDDNNCEETTTNREEKVPSFIYDYIFNPLLAAVDSESFSEPSSSWESSEDFVDSEFEGLLQRNSNKSEQSIGKTDGIHKQPSRSAKRLSTSELEENSSPKRANFQSFETSRPNQRRRCVSESFDIPFERKYEFIDNEYFARHFDFEENSSNPASGVDDFELSDAANEADTSLKDTYDKGTVKPLHFDYQQDKDNNELAANMGQFSSSLLGHKGTLAMPVNESHLRGIYVKNQGEYAIINRKHTRFSPLISEISVDRRLRLTLELPSYEIKAKEDSNVLTKHERFTKSLEIINRTQTYPTTYEKVVTGNFNSNQRKPQEFPRIKFDNERNDGILKSGKSSENNAAGNNKNLPAGKEQRFEKVRENSREKPREISRENPNQNCSVIADTDSVLQETSNSIGRLKENAKSLHAGSDNAGLIKVESESYSITNQEDLQDKGNQSVIKKYSGNRNTEIPEIRVVCDESFSQEHEFENAGVDVEVWLQRANTNGELSSQEANTETEHLLEQANTINELSSQHVNTNEKDLLNDAEKEDALSLLQDNIDEILLSHQESEHLLQEANTDKYILLQQADVDCEHFSHQANIETQDLLHEESINEVFLSQETEIETENEYLLLQADTESEHSLDVSNSDDRESQRNELKSKSLSSLPKLLRPDSMAWFYRNKSTSMYFDDAGANAVDYGQLRKAKSAEITRKKPKIILSANYDKRPVKETNLDELMKSLENVRPNAERLTESKSEVVKEMKRSKKVIKNEEKEGVKRDDENIQEQTVNVSEHKPKIYGKEPNNIREIAKKESENIEGVTRRDRRPMSKNLQRAKSTSALGQRDLFPFKKEPASVAKLIAKFDSPKSESRAKDVNKPKAKSSMERAKSWNFSAGEDKNPKYVKTDRKTIYMKDINNNQERADRHKAGLSPNLKGHDKSSNNSATKLNYSENRNSRNSMLRDSRSANISRTKTGLDGVNVGNNETELIETKTIIAKEKDFNARNQSESRINEKIEPKRDKNPDDVAIREKTQNIVDEDKVAIRENTHNIAVEDKVKRTSTYGLILVLSENRNDSEAEVTSDSISDDFKQTRDKDFWLKNNAADSNIDGGEVLEQKDKVMDIDLLLNSADYDDFSEASCSACNKMPKGRKCSQCHDAECAEVPDGGISPEVLGGRTRSSFRREKRLRKWLEEKQNSISVDEKPSADEKTTNEQSRRLKQIAISEGINIKGLKDPKIERAILNKLESENKFTDFVTQLRYLINLEDDETEKVGLGGDEDEDPVKLLKEYELSRQLRKGTSPFTSDDEGNLSDAFTDITDASLSDYSRSRTSLNSLSLSRGSLHKSFSVSSENKALSTEQIDVKIYKSREKITVEEEKIVIEEDAIVVKETVESEAGMGGLLSSADVAGMMSQAASAVRNRRGKSRRSLGKSSASSEHSTEATMSPTADYKPVFDESTTDISAVVSHDLRHNHNHKPRIELYADSPCSLLTERIGESLYNNLRPKFASFSENPLRSPPATEKQISQQFSQQPANTSSSNAQQSLASPILPQTPWSPARSRSQKSLFSPSSPPQRSLSSPRLLSRQPLSQAISAPQQPLSPAISAPQQPWSSARSPSQRSLSSPGSPPQRSVSLRSTRQPPLPPSRTPSQRSLSSMPSSPRMSSHSSMSNSTVDSVDFGSLPSPIIKQLTESPHQQKRSLQNLQDIPIYSNSMSASEQALQFAHKSPVRSRNTPFRKSTGSYNRAKEEHRSMPNLASRNVRHDESAPINQQSQFPSANLLIKKSQQSPHRSPAYSPLRSPIRSPLRSPIRSPHLSELEEDHEDYLDCDTNYSDNTGFFSDSSLDTAGVFAGFNGDEEVFNSHSPIRRNYASDFDDFVAHHSDGSSDEFFVPHDKRTEAFRTQGREIHCAFPPCKNRDYVDASHKTNFTSCIACFTYYCSKECRKAHWREHKQTCYYGRVNYYTKALIRRFETRNTVNERLSEIAMKGFQNGGRGCVLVTFSSPMAAKFFLVSGTDSFVTQPVFASLNDISSGRLTTKHHVLLLQTMQDYNPEQEFVVDVTVYIGKQNEVRPASQSRMKSTALLRCTKIPINLKFLDGNIEQPSDSSYDIKVFYLPRSKQHHFVNDTEARRHYCREISYGLRRYGIQLKTDYPEVYDKLCMYVEDDIEFVPITLYGQANGRNYKCIVFPEEFDRHSGTVELQGRGMIV